MSTWLSFFINLHHYTGITTVDSKIGPRGLESRQKLGEMSLFCLLDSPKLGCADLKVDKKRWKCLIFVYRRLQKRGALLRE